MPNGWIELAILAMLFLGMGTAGMGAVIGHFRYRAAPRPLPTPRPEEAQPAPAAPEAQPVEAAPAVQAAAPAPVAPQPSAAPPVAPPTPPLERVPPVVPVPPVAPTAPPVVPKPAAPAAPTPDWFGGLRKTRSAWVERLGRLLGSKTVLDAATLDEIEELLFGADLGTRTADQLLEAARQAGSPDHVRDALRAAALQILTDTPFPSHVEFSSARPHVVLVVGVNGSGKTTSIGKLAHRHVQAGEDVVLAAADTFRAAAIDQLGIWAGRAGAEFVRTQPGGDPAAVAFDAVKIARARSADRVFIDTAGRLQTDRGLMDELRKIARVVKKEIPDAPHEVLLVLDAHTGQNAIRQAQEFTKAVDVTGLVLTKLDGTAKGGVVLGITQELGLPVRYVGIGEGIDDLADFDPPAFVDALLAT